MSHFGENVAVQDRACEPLPLRLVVGEVVHNEAPQGKSHGDHLRVVGEEDGSGASVAGVVGGDGTAEGHAAVHGHVAERGVQHLAADVVEVHVDQAGFRRLREVGFKGGTFVVQAW